MITYRLSNNYQGREGMAKLSEFATQLPGQAAGILVALHELGASEAEVAEATIVEHINKPENYKRLWPNSQEKKNTQKGVSNTVAQYRPSFKLLPFIKVVASKRVHYAKGPRKPDVLSDPITGEVFDNPFRRKRGKNAKSGQAGA